MVPCSFIVTKFHFVSREESGKVRGFVLRRLQQELLIALEQYELFIHNGI